MTPSLHRQPSFSNDRLSPMIQKQSSRRAQWPSAASLSDVVFDEVLMSPGVKSAQLTWLRRQMPTSRGLVSSPARGQRGWTRLRRAYYRPGPPSTLRPAIVKASFRAEQDGELSVQAGTRVREIGTAQSAPERVAPGWTHCIHEKSGATTPRGLGPAS